MGTAAAAAKKPGVKEFNFSYVGKDKTNKVVRGDMKATGEAQVNATLRRQGIKVVEIKKQKLSGGGRIRCLPELGSDRPSAAVPAAVDGARR